MRVKMKVAVSGSRNGEAWPPIGGMADLPDDEGAQLCAADLADPVTDDDVETTVPSTEDVETRGGEDDLSALQAEAKTAGVKVDKRWGADRLRQEIADAKTEG